MAAPYRFSVLETYEPVRMGTTWIRERPAASRAGLLLLREGKLL